MTDHGQDCTCGDSLREWLVSAHRARLGVAGYIAAFRIWFRNRRFNHDN